MVHYLVWLLVIILYAPIFQTLYSFRWDKVDYTHAYFILPIVLWLTFRKRTRIKELFRNNEPSKIYLGLPFLVLGILMFIFAWRQDYLFLSTLSLIPVLFGIVTYLYGIKMTKTLTFPILYLLLLVPPPFGILDSITLPMRHAASYSTELSLSFIGYPITREGLELIIGYHKIAVGEPCSGFRSLITLFSLGIVYVYISKNTFLKKIILTAFIVPLALFGNLIRIIILCLITFYFGAAAGQGFFHNFSGILMFIITVLGLIGMETILERIWSTTANSPRSTV